MWHSRLAPTPSGYLHIGNAFNFLLTQELTLSHSGTLRLRIDDLDAPRVRPEYIQDVFDTLQWLGITWQEGPDSAAMHGQRYTQSLRLTRYMQLIERLIRTGKVYACTCSRTSQQSIDPCRDKNLPYDTPGAALKIKTPEEVIAVQDHIAGNCAVQIHQQMPDFVICRRDGIPAYQVASLADDIDYGINAIVRGIDLIDSTAAQLYIARLLGEEVFLQTQFYHHPLLHDAADGKLSKSAGSRSLKAQREAGTTAEQIMEEYGLWRSSFEIR